VERACFLDQPPLRAGRFSGLDKAGLAANAPAMEDIAIRVENLEKKYILRHQIENQHKNYTALRDVLAESARSAWKRLRHRSSSVPSASQEEFFAIRDVSFDVKRGEALAVIGRNGAGKSTLLKLLSRITTPSGGSIEMEGRLASLLEVGTGFHPELTGRENIFLNGAIIGMTRAEIRRKFDAIVAFAEVEKFLDTPVKRYSSGMYVRLAFSVAAHLESEILIVDEVLAVGDAEFQKKCIGKMDEVRRSDRTVLFVSHNMAAVQQLCTTGILLEKGTVVARGGISDVVNQYLKTAGKIEDHVQLENKSRPWGRDDRVELVAMEVNDGQPIFFAGSAHFMLTVRITSRMRDLCFEIGFSSLDGVRVATYGSDLGDLKVDLEAGLYKINLTVTDLPLQPALYVLDLGVHSGGMGLDFVSAATQVEVIGSAASPSYRTGGAYGSSLRGEWKIQAA
jgi:lipopolysaccharide transport system ATP-binding protein